VSQIGLQRLVRHAQRWTNAERRDKEPFVNSSIRRTILASLLVLVTACSSSTTTPTGAPAPEQSPPPEGTPAAAYPEGPYGKAVGAVLADFEMTGYVRNDATGLATSASLGAVRLSDLRANAGDAKYALIHVSAFWCGICRAAVQDLVTQYPDLAAKAIFVDLLVEGRTPDDVATQANLDSWAKALRVPYSVARDPDGVQFRIRSEIGPNKTAMLLELATMKIVAKSPSDYADVVGKLKTAP
jgi:hypothetical protein